MISRFADWQPLSSSKSSSSALMGFLSESLQHITNDHFKITQAHVEPHALHSRVDHCDSVA